MKKVLCGSLLILGSMRGFAGEGTKLEILHSDNKVFYRAVDETFYEVESSRKVKEATECKATDGSTFTAPAGALVVKIKNLGEYLAGSENHSTGVAVAVQPENQGQVFANQQVAPNGNAAPSSVESQMLMQVNQERARHGLRPLAMSASLSQGSNSQSSAMANRRKMYHSGQPVAENVAAGQSSVPEVVRSWMNSPGHRANILNPNATQFGGSGINSYWTMQVR